jgi:hypothetical protein
MIIGTRVFLRRNFEHLRQTKDLAQCFLSGHDLTGYEKTHALYQGTTKQLAEKLSGRRARLHSLRKNSCFVSGHGYTRCAKTHALYQGTATLAAQNSCFVSGHGFSRAVPDATHEGFSPWVRYFGRVRTSQAAEKLALGRRGL